MDEQDERAVRTSFSLYDRHQRIVEAYAQRDGRSQSNALQRIIDEWAEEHLDEWNNSSCAKLEASHEMHPA